MSTIEDLVQASLNQDYNGANEIFGDLMSSKISDALEQEKIQLANNIYNGVEEEEEVEDFDVDDLEDEDFNDEEDLEDDEEDLEDDEEEDLEDEDE